MKTSTPSEDFSRTSSKLIDKFAEINNILPHNANLDYTNALSFSKGCYIGQEITARANFTGIIRKRMCVFVACAQMIDDYDYDAPENRLDMLSHVGDDVPVNLKGKIVKDESGDKLLVLGWLIRLLQEHSIRRVQVCG